jgi:DNA-binding LytR/AlgR family response regulator
MIKLKIGIVEDEVIIADNIADILQKLGYKVAEPAATYAEAMQMIEDEKPDLLLLDIQLKGKKDGIDIATKINEVYRIPFIFLTANADTATVDRAKKANPSNYLVKPFTKEDLYAAIEVCLYNSYAFKAARPLTAGSNFALSDALFIKDGQLFYKVKFSDILYMESEHVYVNVYTAHKSFLVRSSLNDYLANFDAETFFRIHRSYVINLNHVHSVSAECVIINGVTLPVGRSYRQQLFGRLNLG